MTCPLPSLRNVSFVELSRDYGREFGAQARYEPPMGPVFIGQALILSRSVLPSERSRLRTELFRRAFNDLNNQVQAHRDVTLPIPNH